MNLLMINLEICSSERLNRHIEDILENKISALHLSLDNDKNRAGIVRLFEAIKINTSILYLSFSAKYSIIDGYQHRPHIDAPMEKLIMNFAELLSYMLKHNTTLKYVTLKYACLDEMSFGKIMESLKVNTSVFFLDLYVYSCGHNYILSIADMLSHNITLERFRLSFRWEVKFGKNLYIIRLNMLCIFIIQH